MELDNVVDNIINFTADLEFFIKSLIIITLLYIPLYSMITLLYSESNQFDNLQTLIHTIQGAISPINIIYIIIISIGVTYLHKKLNETPQLRIQGLLDLFLEQLTASLQAHSLSSLGSYLIYH